MTRVISYILCTCMEKSRSEIFLYLEVVKFLAQGFEVISVGCRSGWGYCSISGAFRGVQGTGGEVGVERGGRTDVEVGGWGLSRRGEESGVLRRIEEKRCIEVEGAGII